MWGEMDVFPQREVRVWVRHWKHNSFLKIKENISHSQEVDFCSPMALTMLQSFFINTLLPVKRSDNQIGVCLRMWPLNILINMRIEGTQRKQQVLCWVIGLLPTLHSNSVNGRPNIFIVSDLATTALRSFKNAHYPCYLWHTVTRKTVHINVFEDTDNPFREIYKWNESVSR